MELAATDRRMVEHLPDRRGQGFASSSTARIGRVTSRHGPAARPAGPGRMCCPSTPPPRRVDASPRRVRCPRRPRTDGRRNGPRRSSSPPDPARTGPRPADRPTRSRPSPRTSAMPPTYSSRSSPAQPRHRPAPTRPGSGGRHPGQHPAHHHPTQQLGAGEQLIGRHRHPPKPSTARTRGRYTGTQRPPTVTEPALRSCRVAVRSGSCLARGPQATVTSASISCCITCNRHQRRGPAAPPAARRRSRPSPRSPGQAG